MGRRALRKINLVFAASHLIRFRAPPANTMTGKGQTATSAGAWATSACPSTTDVRLVPPQSVARSFRERDFVRGPRDRGLRAHFGIFVFRVLFSTMPRKAGRDIDEDASWNALVELVGFDLCQ